VDALPRPSQRLHQGAEGGFSVGEDLHAVSEGEAGAGVLLQEGDQAPGGRGEVLLAVQHAVEPPQGLRGVLVLSLVPGDATKGPPLGKGGPQVKVEQHPHHGKGHQGQNPGDGAVGVLVLQKDHSGDDEGVGGDQVRKIGAQGGIDPPGQAEAIFPEGSLGQGVPQGQDPPMKVVEVLHRQKDPHGPQGHQGPHADQRMGTTVVLGHDHSSSIFQAPRSPL